MAAVQENNEDTAAMCNEGMGTHNPTWNEWGGRISKQHMANGRET